MDILTTQDRGIVTDSPRSKTKEDSILENCGKPISTGTGGKAEKKKTESKKLKKKLNEVEGQNESLAKVIDEKNNEILELKKSINALNDILNSVPIDELRCNSSIASVKILDLSKKNRQLRAELETTKNRLSRKEQEIRKLEKDLEQEQNKQTLNKDSSKIGVRNKVVVKVLHLAFYALTYLIFTESRRRNAQ